MHKVQEKVSGSHLSQDPILVVCSPPQMYSGHSIKKKGKKVKKKRKKRKRKKGDTMRRLIRPPVLKRQMPLLDESLEYWTRLYLLPSVL